ncbi:Organ specific protein [Trema orientale]|uniref:Organ specific protein n=1 Tax=Trema orientale TaxID=63057 RepID=A0A2P5EH72_TREOI|nr:Organ specific protein [Trema orientale]
MKSPCAVILSLFSLLLLAISTESRKDPAGEYWKNVMKDQPIPKAVHGLISSSSSSTSSHDSNEKANCHENNRAFTKNFEPTPNISAYPDDSAKESTTRDNVFTRNFEPTPNVSAYPDDTTAETSTKDNLVATNKENKQYAESFEPRPNISVYSD